MARQIALLRGINLASRNRVSMPDLRKALEAAGYEDVATLVQSGNIVLTSAKKPKTLETEISALVKDEFGVVAATVVRTRDELAGVIERNPIPAGPSIAKLFQVTFFSDEPDAARVAELEGQDFGNEELVVIGREAYAWHPDGIQKSKLARELGKGLRGDGTARNWNTVTKLLELADSAG
ncbi:MAG TPA: DUF1697 domain-containing protein [Solirubrobacteraceae bacterium]|nr:DUF1697 domain-containing protein [Solirubrobacteraceae bacterium]